MAGNIETEAGPRPKDTLGQVVWGTDQAIRRIEDALNLVAAAAIMLLVGLSIFQIVLRLLPLAGMHEAICGAVFGAGESRSCEQILYAILFGYIDLVELSMPILAILGIAYVQRHGAHIRMDILISQFRARLLWIVEMFAALLTLIIAILLARFAWTFFYDAYSIGDSTTDAEISTWPSKLLVPLAFALWAIRMAVQFLGALRLSIDPGLPPVGVVVQKDIAEQAQEEIREAMGGENR